MNLEYDILIVGGQFMAVGVSKRLIPHNEVLQTLKIDAFLRCLFCNKRVGD